jgi:putative peptide zinc metalloprotease protein
MYKDRVSGLIAGLWRSGLPERILLLLFVAGLLSPIVHATATWLGHRLARFRDARREKNREADAPRRLDALRLTRLATLPAESIEALAREASWLHPRRAQGRQPDALPAVFAVVDGARAATR